MNLRKMLDLQIGDLGKKFLYPPRWLSAMEFLEGLVAQKTADGSA